ncbi:ABC transporter substrate-binding protein [Leucobacter sp. W1153]|uniref:ABC transporter substrate-binding protein n=1 Tax=Leucobacter sp. W1153 TaxID=3439064 RepID=UPI003F359ADC
MRLTQRAKTPWKTRLTLGLGIASAAALTLAGCQGSAPAPPAEEIVAEVDGDITWFTWGEYVAPGLVEGFEEEYGVSVTIENFDSNENMIQKLASGQAYDVITGNSAYMERMIEGGLLRPYDIAALENYDDIHPYFQSPIYDSGELRYSVPYSGGPTGIIYRTDKVDSITSWADLWAVSEQAEGHVFVLDQIEETIGMSLLSEGEDLNSDDSAAVQSAVDALIELKPSLGGISTNTRDNVATGDAWVHHAWSTDAFMLLSDSPVMDQLEFVYPEEGAPFGMNVLNIGANAKSPGTALLFIDYMTSPEAKVTNVEYLGDLSGSIAGDEAYAEAVAAFPSLQVPADFYESAVWKQSLTGERETIWSQEWNRFKAS